MQSGCRSLREAGGPRRSDADGDDADMNTFNLTRGELETMVASMIKAGSVAPPPQGEGEAPNVAATDPQEAAKRIVDDLAEGFSKVKSKTAARVKPYP